MCKVKYTAHHRPRTGMRLKPALLRMGNRRPKTHNRFEGNWPKASVALEKTLSLKTALSERIPDARSMVLAATIIIGLDRRS
jgi:hypothetical protein